MALLVQEVQGGLINKINENSSSLNSLTWATESVETVVWSNNNTAWIIFIVFNGKRLRSRIRGSEHVHLVHTACLKVIVYVQFGVAWLHFRLSKHSSRD